MSARTARRTGVSLIPTPPLPNGCGRHRSGLPTLPVEPVASIAKTHGDFLEKLNGLLLGDDPADGIFLESRFFQPTFGITLRFPAGWQTGNTSQAVVGYMQDKEALLLVTVAGKGDDPVGSPATPRRKLMSGCWSGPPFWRSTGCGRSEAWSPSRVRVALQCSTSPDCPLGDRVPYPWDLPDAALCRVSRPLRRVRVEFPGTDPGGYGAAPRNPLAVSGGAGGGAAGGRRPSEQGSIWSANEIAVANALAADARLAAGQMVKVAISEPYQGRR